MIFAKFLCNNRLIVAISGFLLLFCACSGKKEYSAVEGGIWNTIYHITYDDDCDYSDSIIAELHRVERSVSVFTPGSTVCSINDNVSLQVDAMFSHIYAASREVWKNSDGYFDPTLSPLIDAYGFEGKRGGLPNSASIDSIRQFVGLDKTMLKDDKVQKSDSRVQFNFSAIAKGYGCDVVGNMLKRNGCENYLVEIGGEIAVAGNSPRGGLWNVQIDKPVFAADSVVHEAQLTIAVRDCGIATSGNYRNFRTDNGKRIGHTFDPHTGMPAVNDMLSATVVASSCMLADAYATACMSMGLERAKKMAQRLNLSVLLIADDGKTYISPSFKKLIVKD